MFTANYFQTDNTALAVALASCGVPVAKDGNGKPVPQIMLYDAETLRGFGYQGMTIDEAAQCALRNRKSGIRIFQFESTPELCRIVKAFNEAESKLKAGENITIEEVECEWVAAIVASTQRMRREMLSNFRIPAFIGSVATTMGPKDATGGWSASGKLSAISVGASEKLKSEVRL